MYTNIDIDTGLTSISELLQTNYTDTPTNFPAQLFLKILEIIMKNNIFQFGPTYWLQLNGGTAMETPTACAYATLTFRSYENTTILQKFQNNLLYYKRYIDDIWDLDTIPRQPTNNLGNIQNNTKRLG